MSDHEQPPTADPAGQGALVRTGLGAIALVAVVSLAFWGIGTVRDEAGTPVVAEGEDPQAPEDEPDPAEEPEPAEEPDDEPEPAEDPEPADEPEPADDPEPDDDDADGADGSEDDGAAEDEPGERAVEPGGVTIQVLDGFKADGGAAADQVAQILSGVGYDIIARNDALNYDVTTVLYNPGNEAAARQVAADLGGAEVRPQPGNLSSAPSLHVVVGADRG